MLISTEVFRMVTKKLKLRGYVVVEEKSPGFLLSQE